MQPIRTLDGMDTRKAKWLVLRSGEGDSLARVEVTNVTTKLEPGRVFIQFDPVRFDIAQDVREARVELLDEREVLLAFFDIGRPLHARDAIVINSLTVAVE